MLKKHISEFVKDYLIKNITKNDIIVDATVGNGHDTLFLAERCKFVYGFDIQPLAITNTENRLKSHNKTNYQLFLKSHEYILDYVSDFKGVIFNLGYLPNSDKTITTTKETTINSLKSLTLNMKPKTFIIITCYINHEEGLIEANEVLNYTSILGRDFSVFKYEKINSLKKAPFVIVVEKN